MIHLDLHEGVMTIATFTQAEKDFLEKLMGIYDEEDGEEPDEESDEDKE